VNDEYMNCSDCGFDWLDAGQDVCPCCGGHNIGYEEDGDEDDLEGFEEEDE